MVTRNTLGKHELPFALTAQTIESVERELKTQIEEEVRRYVQGKSWTITQDGHTFIYRNIDISDFQITELNTHYS